MERPRKSPKGASARAGSGSLAARRKHGPFWPAWLDTSGRVRLALAPAWDRPIESRLPRAERANRPPRAAAVAITKCQGNYGYEVSCLLDRQGLHSRRQRMAKNHVPLVGHGSAEVPSLLPQIRRFLVFDHRQTADPSGDHQPADGGGVGRRQTFGRRPVAVEVRIGRQGVASCRLAFAPPARQVGAGPAPRTRGGHRPSTKPPQQVLTENESANDREHEGKSRSACRLCTPEPWCLFLEPSIA